jgi:hypothetical protein
MSALIFAVLVLIIAAMLIYAVQHAPIVAPFNWLLEVLIVLIAALAIAERAGLT